VTEVWWLRRLFYLTTFFYASVWKDIIQKLLYYYCKVWSCAILLEPNI